jgi:hypothetical protein
MIIYTKVLLDTHQNPKERMLVFNSDGVHVLSECCKAQVDDERTISVIRKGIQVEEMWSMCSRCNRTLECNNVGWTSHPPVEHIEGTSPQAWARWGKYWFGLDEFGMEVSW